MKCEPSGLVFAQHYFHFVSRITPNVFFPAFHFVVNNLKLDQADNYSYYWWQKTDEDSSKSGAAGDTCHAHIHDLWGAYGERSRVTTSPCTPPTTLRTREAIIYNGLLHSVDGGNAQTRPVSSLASLCVQNQALCWCFHSGSHWLHRGLYGGDENSHCWGSLRGHSHWSGMLLRAWRTLPSAR